MSGCLRALLLGLLVGTGGADAPAPLREAPAPTASPQVSPVAQAVAPEQTGSASPALDPEIASLRQEVERLEKAAAEAEAAAADDVARLRARVDLSIQLLLLVLRQQERWFVQNQAPRSELARPDPHSVARPSEPSATPRAPSVGLQANTPAGPLFGKRGGDKVHRAGCHAGERISKASRATFPSLAAARAAGFAPCQICRPDRP